VLFARILDRGNTPETAKLRLIMPCYIPRKSFIDLTGLPDKAHDRCNCRTSNIDQNESHAHPKVYWRPLWFSSSDSSPLHVAATCDPVTRLLQALIGLQSKNILLF
jgi:hypothetical protein